LLEFMDISDMDGRSLAGLGSTSFWFNLTLGTFYSSKEEPA